ncbi:MAG: MMPL family transporter [Bacteroidota bacterium]
MSDAIWKYIAKIILDKKIACLIAIALFAVFMGFYASKVQISYELPKILPKSDPNYQLYESFKKRFGEDGNVLLIGVETNKMYDLTFMQKWIALGKKVGQIKGIKKVVSNADLQEIVRNDGLQKFEFKPLLAQNPTQQSQVDSLKNALEKLPAYHGLLFNDARNAHLMLVTFDEKILNGFDRFAVTKAIKEYGQAFGNETNTPVHYSGMPFIRSEFSSQVSAELKMFLVLAIIVTCIILALFFKSFKVVIFALVVILIGIASSLGIIYLYGYQITLLSGLIPPLVIVIGVPNLIFLVNKYHEEFAEHGDQKQALYTAIEKVGPTLFLANITTSIGFGVFAFTSSKLLMEFGMVSAINISLTFLVTLIFVPIAFSLIGPPTKHNLSHLEGKRITAIISGIEKSVMSHRTKLYWLVGIVIIVSIYGLSKIKAIGYVVDDLPKNNPIYTDLKWVERHFKGVVPFEVAIDAKEPGKATSPQILTKIRRVEREFAKYPEFTKPISLVTATKFIYQAYRGGDTKYYVLPGIDELQKLSNYRTSIQGRENQFAGFMDSTRQYTRVSFQMADVGTVRTKQIIRELQPKIDTIFNYDTDSGKMLSGKEAYFAKITGNGVVFALGNEYLLSNLIESTIEAVILISIIMALLFLNWRMVIISILPSIIPLIITAGLMGFAGIALKPSTILIFSIAFGISSDGTIYFLTRYKDELKNGKKSVLTAISNTIQKTGVSMFYTAIILFAGFFIFTASTFKGTQALGLLISLTLLFSMICNLILLPAFIATIDKRVTQKKRE